jgi:hypothetical protein
MANTAGGVSYHRGLNFLPIVDGGQSAGMGMHEGYR